MAGYKNAIHIFSSLLDVVSINMDFSEKLKIPLKKEPQSVHWSGAKIIVHFHILKKGSNKEYYYLSDQLIQDHAFSYLVLDEMLEDINHNQKGMKHLERVFLGNFDSGNLYTFFRESVMFLSVQAESKKGPFEHTNEKLLMIN